MSLPKGIKNIYLIIATKQYQQNNGKIEETKNVKLNVGKGAVEGIKYLLITIISRNLFTAMQY